MPDTSPDNWHGLSSGTCENIGSMKCQVRADTTVRDLVAKTIADYVSFYEAVTVEA